MEMPKTLGATIDAIYKLTESRRLLEAKIDAIKQQETALKDYLKNNFSGEGLDGARGKYATAAIKRSEVADVTDWEAFYKYLSRNKAFDLLQRRVSLTALRERWAAKKSVPGVSSKMIETISITKSSK